MQRFIKLVSTFAALLSIASSALSQTGLESAKEKFQTCMFCHSAQTSSVPGIDNQRPKYIVSQLLAYKTGVRVMAAYWSASPEVRQLGNMTMRDQAARLTEEEMQAIAS